MTREECAAEAKRITESGVVKDALSGMRTEALEALAIADANDADEIRARQADVRAIDAFMSSLEATILNGQPMREIGVA